MDHYAVSGEKQRCDDRLFKLCSVATAARHDSLKIVYIVLIEFFKSKRHLNGNGLYLLASFGQLREW